MYRSPDPLGRHLIDQAVAKLLQEQQSRGESSRWSIREQLLNLGYGHPLTGAAAECYQQAVRDGWQPQTTNSLFIPYGHQRMLSVAVAAWGGNLVGTWVPPASRRAALRAGVQPSCPSTCCLCRSMRNVTLPRHHGQWHRLHPAHGIDRDHRQPTHSRADSHDAQEHRRLHRAVPATHHADQRCCRGT